ncbi:MAG: amidophosphoribosyltransferase [Ignavibacteria bacterium]|nr:amidophosphoribosyltransferase [Ignavibacteria bacterium]MBT8381277.1 amidophosphoribosyltransferase [Ignavibacteria bacterium]MBT8390314.1 amidophosphoribosyltransferase [Ignavibacteria bacterium]NNJ53081.1 amidophosphoribosyltransferase [Ignavibacteriaceae bacterium]NNL20285.1 amidophosphoribosyltransferase [Ignavibacteriaceae bacterium]
MNLTREKPTCNCGIMGVFGLSSAAIESYYGIHALQHRGQEACGIVTQDFNENGKSVFHIYKGEGLVTEVFEDSKILKNELTGTAAIGHNRYSTTGSAESVKNIQPFVVHYRKGNLAVAHNGNLTNARELREKLVNEGAIFQTTSDTEVILHLIARSRLEDQVEQIKEAIDKIEGAFSLVLLTDDKLIASRDANGFRPLSIAKLNGGYIVASETCAFDLLSAEFIREVHPGEIIVIDNDVLLSNSIKSISVSETPVNKKHCVFEYIYFSRPDSFIYGHNVDKMRRRLGKSLARNHPVYNEDEKKVIVISVPDSSNTTAVGYQKELDKLGVDSKLEIGLIRSHYIGRTFIQPGQSEREIGVKIKFNTVKGVLEGRTVVLVDDSIVRGTTSKQLVKLIREANPKSIHLRISSPPIAHPCFYGMDFPSREELIANNYQSNIEEIGKYLGVDSLRYLTIDEMLEAVAEAGEENFCHACFSGSYPTEIDKSFKKEIYEI